MGVAIVLLDSCANEAVQPDPVGPIPANSLRVAVDIDDARQTVKKAETRVSVPAEADEATIKSLYLLFFDDSEDGTGQFVDFVEIENPQDNASRDIVMTGTSLSVTAPYRILAIANIGDLGVAGRTTGAQYLSNEAVTSWMTGWMGHNEAQVIAEAQAWAFAGEDVLPGELLMSGRAYKEENNFHVNITLQRNQARFDVLRGVELKDDPNDPNDEEFELYSIEIRNAYPISKIWSDGSKEGGLSYADETGRIQQYYGYSDANPDTAKKLSSILNNGDLKGYLYAFENRTAPSTRNDNITTSLIIGLRKVKPTAEPDPRYYRINIVPEENSQMLRRNNVYSVSINSVGGLGDTTPQAAYDNPKQTEIGYTINGWDMPGTGIVVQDGNSLLSAPLKTVNMKRGEMIMVGGNQQWGRTTTTLQITTFTNKTDPVALEEGKLTIAGQEYHLNGSTDPYNGIFASLNETTGEITIGADPIESTYTVRGEIRLTYMGLRATINVVQTDLTTDFLEVHLPDGGIPVFAPFKGIPSGLLRVEASGAWTAEILMENESIDSFSFSPTGALPVTKINSVTDAAMLAEYDPVLGNKFRVYTHGANMRADATREAYIVVTLDKDSENYADMVRVKQAPKAELAINPNRTLTFDGAGELSAIPNNDSKRFTVLPGVSTDGDAYNQWTVSITAAPGTPANAFVLTSDSTTDANDPAEDNWFEVTPDTSNSYGGKNVSGGNYSATVTVTLNASGVKATINVVQTSAGITLSPNTVPAVSNDGGTSQPIGVQADASLRWKVISFTTEATGGPHPTLVHHAAELLLENDTPVDIQNGEYAIAQKFKVRFPKIYYPNRNFNISAKVVVGIVGSSLQSTITINQTPLTAAPMVAWGLTGSPNYGALGDTYNRGWDGNSGHWGLKQIPGFRVLGSSAANGAGTINASVNYLSVTAHIGGASGTNYSWMAVKDYIKNRDAFTIIQSQDNYGRGPLNNGNSPLRDAGYPMAEYGRDVNGIIYEDTDNSNTRIWKFLFDESKNEFKPSDVTANNYWYIDGVNNWLPIDQLPGTAVVLIAKRVSDAANGASASNEAMLIVDVENKFIWMGESQLFWYDSWIDNNRYKLLENLMYYVANTAKYGSHFTDLLLEEDAGPSGNGNMGDGRVSQPPLWDEAHWGRNIMLEIDNR